MEIDWDKLMQFSKPSQVVYKRHIMRYIQKLTATSELNSPLYHHFFNKKNGIAYFQVQYADVIDTIQAVISSGGFPVLAHPILEGNLDLIPELVPYGLSGIEIRHPSHSIEQEITLYKMARYYGLIVTGRSDFHGINNYPGECGINDAELSSLLHQAVKKI